MIDEVPLSHGSHGKDRFVYSALSLSLWQLDLCRCTIGSLLGARSAGIVGVVLKRPMHLERRNEKRLQFDPETGATGARLRLERESDAQFVG